MTAHLGDPPAAVRSRTPGWRDPRLWIGVAIVAISVVAGARILGSDDDTVVVWAAASDLPVGSEVTEDDLVATRVHFADDDDLALYFRGDRTLPSHLRLNRPVDSGELLPRSAALGGRDDGKVLLPINLEDGAMARGLSAGSTVDVYVDAGRRCTECAQAVLDDVPVIEVNGSDDLGTRQVVLAVDQEQVDGWFALIGRYDTATVTVAEQG